MFHVRITSRPAELEAGPEIAIEGQVLCTVTRDELAASLFVVSFEEAAAALGRLPRTIIEPDGSFVLSGEEQGRRWQLDGALYDRSDHLSHVELRGNSPSAVLDQLLGCLGWPENQVIFEIISRSVYVDEPTFRRWLEKIPAEQRNAP